GVEFPVTPGVTIVFGESGSGKTTLLRSIAGFTCPEHGRVTIGERVLYDSGSSTNVDPSLRRVGFVFQDLALFPHLSAARNIEYGLAAVDRDERRRRTVAIAAPFDIADVLGRRPKQISAGERPPPGPPRHPAPKHP